MWCWELLSTSSIVTNNTIVAWEGERGISLLGTIKWKWKWSHSVVSMDCSLPGSSVHGIFQARVLEWVAISFSRGSSQPRKRTRVSRTAGRRFTIWATREAPLSIQKKCFKWDVLCTVLSHSVMSDCDSMDCSPPGSSVHGILQARILE